MPTESLKERIEIVLNSMTSKPRALAACLLHG